VRVEWLDTVASSPSGPASPAKSGGTVPRTLALVPVAETLMPIVSPAPTGSTVSWPPRGIAWPAISSMLSSSLTRFLAKRTRGRFQVILVFSSSRSRAKSFRHRRCRSANRRNRGAEGDPAELQFGGGSVGAFLDQFEREGLGFLVLVFGQNFQSVDDGANRADQVVTDPRAQQGGEIERFNGDPDMDWSPQACRVPKRLSSNGRIACRIGLSGVIHRASATPRLETSFKGEKHVRPATDGLEITPQQAEQVLEALSEIVSRAAQATSLSRFHPSSTG